MNKDPFITVFTITYNQQNRIRKTVEDLFAQDYAPHRYEIIVLDDGSTDGTQNVLQQLKRNNERSLKIITTAHEANYMNAKRWNQAIAAASEQTNVFIHVEDVEMRPDFLRQHVKWHSGPEHHVVTGSKFEADEQTWELDTCLRNHLAGTGGKARRIPEYTAVWSASLSYTKEMARRIYAPPFDMPYDERMNGWGFHEVEFAYRMQQAGAQIIYDPAAGVFHKNHQQLQELRRGLNRDEILANDTEKNIQYILHKHGLKELVRW